MAAEGGALDFSQLGVEPPRDPAHGDCRPMPRMVLAKPLGMSIRVSSGDKLAAKLSEDPDVEAAVDRRSRLHQPALSAGLLAASCLRRCCESEADYGRSSLGGGTKVNVEYVSANPTGPMHVGHCRGAVVGDALANLLAFAGYEVTKEYYINDAGAQIDVLARSVFLRYREALGETDRRYPGRALSGRLSGAGRPGAGEGLRPQACSMMPEDEWLPIVKEPRHRRDDGDDPRRSRGAQRRITTCSSPSAPCMPKAKGG